MPRVIIFLSFLLGLVLLMNLKKYKEKELGFIKRPFNFAERKVENERKKKELAQMMALKKKEEKTEEKTITKEARKGPLVPLLTKELQRGAKLYKKCILCHGRRGQGKKSQKAPAIGGQFDWYLEEQMSHMQAGRRVNKVMYPYIRNLNPQDIKDLALYISKLPPMGK